MVGMFIAHDRVIEAFIAQDITPRYIQFVTQVTSALAIVSSGLGLALTPASASRTGFEGVTFIPIQDALPESIKTVAVGRRDSDNPALTRLLELI